MKKNDNVPNMLRGTNCSFKLVRMMSPPLSLLHSVRLLVDFVRLFQRVLLLIEMFKLSLVTFSGQEKLFMCKYCEVCLDVRQ